MWIKFILVLHIYTVFSGNLRGLLCTLYSIWENFVNCAFFKYPIQLRPNSLNEQDPIFYCFEVTLLIHYPTISTYCI